MELTNTNYYSVDMNKKYMSASSFKDFLNCEKEALAISAKIAESSKKYVYDGQMGIILNKVQKDKLPQAAELLKSFELYLLGYIENCKDINSDEIINTLEIIYSRMNLPQIEG